MFSKILIANRGEIACRIISTARRMGISTVAVYSQADTDSLHVEMADEAVFIGPAPAPESYLDGAKIIAAAKETQAQAIHPGYGFLSENPGFVKDAEVAALTFIGPPAHAIQQMGLKDAAKKLMEEAGVPVVPGYHGSNQDAAFLARKAKTIGYPVMIKARAGGGGKGMRRVERPSDFAAALEGAKREGQASFGDPNVLIEKYITAPRHIEVQVFGDTLGNVIHLFERDCSLQRRHQKVIEEAPAPGMSEAMRSAMTQAAVLAANAVDYVGAGTVEFIVDGSGPLRPDGFWFMEMNTRLQVEHTVTEAITGHDLVEWQLRVAAGEALPESQEQQKIIGHAFQARIYAEDTANGFLPATGRLERVVFGDARIDTGVRRGDIISPWYDPMIAKAISHHETREGALGKMRKTLAATHIAGTVTNVGFLSALCSHEEFKKGQVDTGLIERELETLVAPKKLPETALAFAVIAALDLNLAAPFTGWRLWSEACLHIDLTHKGRSLSCDLILLDDMSLSLRGGANDIRLYEISQDGTRVVARNGNLKVSAESVVYFSDDGTRNVSILLDGDTWLFSIPDPLAVKGNLEENANAITAPMTGIIRLVTVKAGDEVKAGDRLVVVEAMKMEHSLSTPRSCKISDVLCSEGDAVDGGAVLIKFANDGA